MDQYQLIMNIGESANFNHGSMPINYGYWGQVPIDYGSLSDETKKFHRDRYRDFFSRPNVFETDTATFFETKFFRD